MNKKHLEAFAQIPQPSRESYGFIADIKKPVEYFTCHPNVSSARITVEYPLGKPFPDTAAESLRRVLAARGIEEKEGGFPLRLRFDGTMGREEYEVCSTASECSVTAADADGLRRGIYFLEDRILEAENEVATFGCWRRKPFVKHRISRCFFGPTNRPPFHIDELTDDVDYYPEEYLNKLAHEGVNGLWLTMYFRDLPSSIFPGRGGNADKRLAKLRRVVEKCGRYGIRIYLFLSEPKLFGEGFYATPFEEAENHRELVGPMVEKWAAFCTSSETAKRYFQESLSQIFSAVPELGGVINIMLGEDNGCCAAVEVANRRSDFRCPVCSRREQADIFAEQAQWFSEAIHRYNPEAEYIGWFYAPAQRDGSRLMNDLLHVAEKWPECATLMFNFESGGAEWQLGRKRIVFDYSLASVGPSELFAKAAEKAPKTGAKLQVGCSHEDASVPFIPVPGNLYRKYRFMYEHGVSAVMQCWYFGNYPGVMNKAAGELSFSPFYSSERDFLEHLARPDWGKNAPLTAKAWEHFSAGYRKFPANLAFEWYGPLHNSIVWPLHLFPVNQPLAPTWLLKNFPEISGDRAGECLGYHHTIEEALALCREMLAEWQSGMDILEKLRPEYRNNPDRLADIDLAKAILIQIKSTCNVLDFYRLRENMLFGRIDHLPEMREIVRSETANTLEMAEICRRDSRIGYHSEAEGYLFFPEKLEARAELLQELLAEDFPKFSLGEPWIDIYTGKNPDRPLAVCDTEYDMGNDYAWSANYRDEKLHVTVKNAVGTNFALVLEPRPLWTPFRIDFQPGGFYRVNSWIFPQEPEVMVEHSGKDILISIPLAPMKEFIRPGFPVKFNIYGDKFRWVEPQKWPSRLMHGDYNPAGAGYLVLN